MQIKNKEQQYVSTQNPCRLCTPFGACMAFAGVADGMAFIHGSQGCSTYIRRYLISHFREPVDIPCSNFSESTVIFGGEDNFRISMLNVIEQYQPKLIGIATTCLAETIGDDLNQFIHRFKKEHVGEDPILVPVSTPSYQGSHTDGFYRAVRGIVEKLAVSGPMLKHINIFPGMVSPEDIRNLKEIVSDFGLDAMILPDYSDSLDGGIWHQYEKNIESGTPIEEIRQSPSACATIEFGNIQDPLISAGDFLLQSFGTPLYKFAFPIGVGQTDLFLERLKGLCGKEIPAKYIGQRSRLIDSYVDGHKYVFGKKAIIYGPQDMVISLAAFLNEIGIIPALCGTGQNKGDFAESLKDVLGENFRHITAIENTDFIQMQETAKSMKIDMVVGDSNGYKLARSLDAPLIRVGLPVHDRIGAQRIATLGYFGTQQLFDRIVNELIRLKQEDSPVGYTHI